MVCFFVTLDVSLLGENWIRGCRKQRDRATWATQGPPLTFFRVNFCRKKCFVFRLVGGAPVTNEGFFCWDSLPKMVHNPGGDWNPGWGVVPN